jgi:phenylpropionate dioxygenase-like ring-hydroxylating dioxygenase large terminal subunit
MALEVDDIVEEIQRGRVPASIYNDASIFDLERDRVFGRAWVYMAHESEIPEPGDYVVRWLVDDSFIVARDELGEIHVMFNMCLHRGMQVCRVEVGNASHFRCPYHAWTYKNNGDLTGVPFHKDAYGGTEGLNRDDFALLRPARVESYNGLIFVSLDADAPPLEDFLGGFTFYLDLYLKQSEAGPEVRGPQRWRVKSDWKIAAENFSGDTYHTPTTHKSVVEIGMFKEPKAHKRKEGVLYFADSGGGTTYKLPEGKFEDGLRYVGYPDEMIERMREVWSPEQQAMVGDAGFMISASSIYPNLSFVHNWPQVNEEGMVVPFISIRLWQPIAPGECEVLSWFAVDSLAPQWYKDASYKSYLMSFGSSGMFEQDDTENWVSVTQVARGRMARSLSLHSGMGLRPDGSQLVDQYEGWPGPGQAYQGFGEYNQRQMLRLWSEDLAKGEVRR